ncbi:MAG: hypothetical protein Q7R39_15835 [Dehalococcoidia bacterium]|nr:hypothetical protein [Dehalococcoidia bacterium]
MKRIAVCLTLALVFGVEACLPPQPVDEDLSPGAPTPIGPVRALLSASQTPGPMVSIAPTCQPSASVTSSPTPVAAATPVGFPSTALPTPVLTPLPSESQASWRRVATPGGGGAYSLLVDPRDSIVLYMGALAGSLYKSQDAGARWTRMVDMAEAIGSAPLAMHPSNPSVILSSQVVWHTGADGAPDRSTTFVWKTSDGGASWMQIPAVESPGPGSIGFGVIAFNPRNPEVIYAGSGSEGVYKSENGGVAWRFSGPGKSQVFSLAVDPGDNQTVYASLNAGVYVSCDAGLTWNETPAGERFSQSVVAGRDGSVFVAPGRYSPDRGCSWVTLPLSARKLALDPDSDRVIYAADFGPSNISGQNTGIRLSTDGGASWSLVGDRVGTGDIWALVVTPTSPRTLYLAGSNGLWATTIPVPAPAKGALKLDVFKELATFVGAPILSPTYVPSSVSCGLSAGGSDTGFSAYWQVDGRRLSLSMGSGSGNPGQSGEPEPYRFRGTSATLIRGRADYDFVLVWKEPPANSGYMLGAKGLSWEEFLRVANSLQMAEP